MKKLKSTIRGVIPLIFLFLLVPITSGLTTWPEYSFDSSNIGLQNESVVGGFVNDTVTYSSIADGSDYQPLASDIDNDGTVEMVGFDGNTLKIYTMSASNTIQLEDEYNMGSPVQSQFWIGDVDNDNLEEIVSSHNGVIYTTEYNGSDFNLSVNSTINSIVTGITCLNTSSIFQCYFGDNDGNLTEYNASAGVSSKTKVDGVGVFNTTHGDHISPAIADIDNDGEFEIAFICDASFDLREDLCVYKQETLQNETSFSSDGKVTPGTNSRVEIMGLLAYNLDAAGFTELIITYVDDDSVSPTDETGNINIFSGGDGSEIQDIVAIDDGITGGVASISNPVIADTDDDGTYEVCAAGARDVVGGSAMEISIECYERDGTLVTNLTNVDLGSGIFTRPNTTPRRYSIAAGNLGTDGRNDILLPNSIFYSVGNVAVSTFNVDFYINLSTSSATKIQSNVMLADFNDDGFLDIGGMFTNHVFMGTSASTNDPPTLTHTFGVTWASPICNGTTVRYSAKEYTEGSPVAGSNYYNDYDTDREALRVDCYGNGTLTNGSFAADEPFVECTYNNPGSYIVTVYIEDEKNKGDISQLDTFGISTITGTAGSTCNTGSIAVGTSLLDSVTTAASATGVSGGISGTLDVITGGDSDSQILIGFVILIIILAGVASAIGNMLIAIMCTAVGLVLITAVGLFPAWILITCIILIVFLGIMALATGSGGG